MTEFRAIEYDGELWINKDCLLEWLVKESKVLQRLAEGTVQPRDTKVILQVYSFFLERLKNIEITEEVPAWHDFRAEKPPFDLVVEVKNLETGESCLAFNEAAPPRLALTRVKNGKHLDMKFKPTHWRVIDG